MPALDPAAFSSSAFDAADLSITADAVIRKAVAGGTTADAVIKRGMVGSFSADAVIGSIAQSITASAVIRRVVAGSVTADAVIGSIAPSVTADAVIRKPIASSFTADAWIYAPRSDPEGPGSYGETPLIEIRVAGVDITPFVLLRDATFSMQVNGTPGQFRFRVRDDGHVFNFVSGSEVTLDIDGKRKFGGYLNSPRRGFAFPVQDTTVPGVVSRWLTLEGVDYNILFRKRVIRKKDNPKDVALRSWPAMTPDDEIIKFVFNEYTDLAEDGATYHGVEHVGYPNPDKAGVVGSGGLYFGDAMTEINRLINGVFYFDQYKDLHFVDVDEADAPFVLTDNPVPDGPLPEIGYREFSHVSDGSKMANDALLWGAGLGSKNLVFSRVRDEDSVAAHGVWQYGEMTSQIYKQTSIDMRAESVVYGTEQSKRGGKDDQQSWSVVTFNRSFSVGQKVEIESEVFGVADVVPIRRMTITFPTKHPQFHLLLSHEIDLPWNIFEQRFPTFSWDHRTEHPVFEGLPPPDWECAPGVIDSFARTVGDGWGSSQPTAIPWEAGALTGATVDGSYGSMGYTSLDTPIARMDLTYPLPVPSFVRIRWFHDTGSGGDDPSIRFINTNVEIRAPGGPSDSWYWTEVEIDVTGFQWKTWVDGDDPPGAYSDVFATPVLDPSMSIEMNGNGVAESILLVDIIEMVCPEGADPVLPIPGRSPLVGDGETVIFPVGFAYHPGSTRVYVDGFFFRPGYEYTELNPDAGLIEFTNPPAESVLVEVFYESNGPVTA